MLKQTASYYIDFDEWAKLAKTDPASFESLRQRVLDHCITHSSRERQQRLRGLQWRINQLRETASNPLAACISISGMMWSTFTDLGDAYRDLQALRRRPAQERARVLPFRPRPPSE